MRYFILYKQIALVTKRLDLAYTQLENQTKTQTDNTVIVNKAEQYFRGYALFFCGSRQLLKKGDSYEFTGPTLNTKILNPRPTMVTNINKFLDTFQAGAGFKVTAPEYALTLLASGKVVDFSNLSKDHSNNVSRLSFLPNANFTQSYVLGLGNGHHRVEARKKQYQDLYDAYFEANTIVRKAQGHAAHTKPMKTIRDDLTKALKALYENCFWLAKVYDWGKSETFNIYIQCAYIIDL